MSTAVQDMAPAADHKHRIDRIFAAQEERALELRTATAAERIARIKKLRQMMFDRREDIHRACYEDFNKPVAEVDATEIMPVVQEANHAIGSLKRWMKPERKRPTLMLFGTSAEVRQEPLGVSLIISPWNYPINLTFGPLVSAIAAGNTAVLKPSEMTPHCAQLMEDMIGECFEERDVAVVQGEVETSKKLLDLPFDHIFFTGSPKVGSIVMAAASKHLAKVTLELGGKSPVIIDKSANLNHAAQIVAWGKFTNNGQTCIAPDYVYVHADIKDEFVAKVREKTKALYGDENEVRNNPDYCRMVNRTHYDRVRSLVEDAAEHGAKTPMGNTPANDENFIAPTLVTDVDPDSRIMQEEIFGPALPVLTFSDADEPVKTINAMPKPLALYVFAKDNDFVEHLLRHTSSGGACINHSMVQFLHGELPFGGVNNSGIGNSHGHYGFKAFSHERAVLRERFSLTALFMPPYTKFTRWFIRFTLKYLS